MMALSFSGCLIQVREEERPLVKFEPIRGELELSAEFHDDEESSPQVRRVGESLALEELLTLSTAGDVYHPNFMVYQAALGLGLIQQYFEFNDQEDTTYSEFNEYDFSAHFLRAKDYPISVFTNKTNELVARQFLGSLDAEENNTGLVWNYRNEKLPMSFQWIRSDIRQRPLGGFFDPQINRARELDKYDRESDNFTYNLSHNFNENSQLNFRANWDFTEQQRADTKTTIDRQRYILDHDYTFGADDQHRLDSTFEYREQEGTAELLTGKWTERLNLQHTEDLQTDYTLIYTDDERETIHNREIRGEAGFQHRLFESLVTNGSVFAAESDLDAQGDLSIRGGLLGLNYRKTNTLGVLTSAYSVNYVHTEHHGGTETGIVIDEPHTFVDPFPIILDRDNVVISSILITDATGLLVYTEGDDYTVTQVNNQVRINLTILGIAPPNLTDGQVVLISYNFLIEPERTEYAWQQNFRIRQQFENGFSVYYRHSRRDEDVQSTFENITEDNYRTDTYGLDFTRGGFHALTEYATRASTRSPFTSARVEGRYRHQFDNRSSGTIRASQTWLDFEGVSPRETDVFRVGGRLFIELSHQMGLQFDIDWRDEDDSNAGRTQGFSTGAEFRWQYRQFNLTTGIEYDQLERDDRDNNSTFMYLRIKRFF